MAHLRTHRKRPENVPRARTGFPPRSSISSVHRAFKRQAGAVVLGIAHTPPGRSHAGPPRRRAHRAAGGARRRRQLWPSGAAACRNCRVRARRGAPLGVLAVGRPAARISQAGAAGGASAGQCAGQLGAALRCACGPRKPADAATPNPCACMLRRSRRLRRPPCRRVLRAAQVRVRRRGIRAAHRPARSTPWHAQSERAQSKRTLGGARRSPQPTPRRAPRRPLPQQAGAAAAVTTAQPPAEQAAAAANGNGAGEEAPVSPGVVIGDDNVGDKTKAGSSGISSGLRMEGVGVGGWGRVAWEAGLPPSAWVSSYPARVPSCCLETLTDGWSAGLCAAIPQLLSAGGQSGRELPWRPRSGRSRGRGARRGRRPHPPCSGGWCG
jgi:hypothetical protein